VCSEGGSSRAAVRRGDKNGVITAKTGVIRGNEASHDFLGAAKLQSAPCADATPLRRVDFSSPSTSTPVQCGRVITIVFLGLRFGE